MSNGYLFDDEHFTAGTRLDVISLKVWGIARSRRVACRVWTSSAKGDTGTRLSLSSLSSGLVACLVGVPFLFAVIAKERLTAGSLALQLGAAGTTAGNDAVITIRRRTPARIRVSDENAAHHKGFVLFN